MTYPYSSGEEDNDAQDKLICLAYQYAPEEIIETLMTIIDKENSEDEHIHITRKLENCWDENLAYNVLEKAKAPNLKPECLGDLLRELLDHEIPEAKSFAESLLPQRIPSNGDERATAVVVARVLISHAKDSGWLIVWPIIQEDPEFGREVIESRAYDIWSSWIAWEALNESELASFFIWLARQYPYSKDPEHKGAHWASPRDMLVERKNAVLNHLENRGTFQACDALRQIASELPELEWLKWTIQRAQENARRKTWMPPAPSHILRLTTDSRLRLVQNGEDLLDTITCSLHRLESRLHGETPASRDIWDKVLSTSRSGSKYRPCDENDFSDYVKRHLDEDLKERGIIVNREVRIHRGERTDIHIDAVTKARDQEVYDALTAIIEVKGCWNPKLKTAMETQLVDRYLRDNHCRHGLYLVGWFGFENWDENDYRKGQTPKMTIKQAKGLFEAQAANLSKEGLEIKAVVLNTALS